ncbi:MAG TPA: diguanylate cyclase [Vicinamibacterales bacterium]
MCPPYLLLTTDALTQLATRDRFSEFLHRDWRRATDDRASIALLLIDVDFFTRFNDTHGQQAGDECLRRIAAVISSRRFSRA